MGNYSRREYNLVFALIIFFVDKYESDTLTRGGISVSGVVVGIFLCNRYFLSITASPTKSQLMGRSGGVYFMVGPPGV